MAWERLCELSELDDGSMMTRTINGVDVLILKGNEGETLVVPPSCPHMSTALCEGFFDGETLTCAKHLWQWSVVDGSARGMAEAPLKLYPSRVQEGELQVEISEEMKYDYQT